RVVGIYAGEESPFGSRLGIRLPSGKPWGVATSSGRIGPSLSFGKANAVTIISGSSSLADAWATRIGNQVKNKKDIERVLMSCEKNPDILGVVIICDDLMGVRGEVNLVKL
ncbi:MAG: hypothetical protein WCP87_01505, partial [Atribacterota bacterium]